MLEVLTWLKICPGEVDSGLGGTYERDNQDACVSVKGKQDDLKQRIYF